MENQIPVYGSEAPDDSTLLAYIRGKATDTQQKAVEGWVGTDTAHEKELFETARLYYAQMTAKRIASRDSRRAYAKVEKGSRKTPQDPAPKNRDSGGAV